MYPITRIIETGIYVDDLDAAMAFYQGVLGLDVMGREDGHHVFFRVGGQVLLAFIASSTERGGRLPPHGAHGPGHFALGILPDDLDGWRARLEAAGVVIEQVVDWPKGGRSLYTRDPAGNLVELATPGIWGLPSGW